MLVDLINDKDSSWFLFLNRKNFERTTLRKITVLVAAFFCLIGLVVIYRSVKLFKTWNQKTTAVSSEKKGKKSEHTPLEIAEISKKKDKEQKNTPLEIKDILGIEERLNKRIRHQHEATQKVASSLLAYAAGINHQERPIGVFLFVGPTGVGKTELAKAFSDQLYLDKPSGLVRFDMSHFTEYHSISRLIGSQPGYMNHDEGGQLTNPLAEDPKVVVLLDEIEKAHSQVRKIFLPLFDEGFILDTKNKRVLCKDTVFIMTSNLCANKISELFILGRSSQQILAAIEPTLIEALSPELYNRVQPILFRPLDREAIGDLVEFALGNLAKRVLERKNIKLVFHDSLKKYLRREGYNPQLGARPLNRLIEEKVTAAISRYLITNKLQEGDQLLVSYEVEIKINLCLVD